MADFKQYWVPSNYVLETLSIASATVIEKGDMVGLTDGLVIKGVAATAALAFAMQASAVGDTTIQVCNSPDAIYQGTGDANFAVAQQGDNVDLAGTTTQLIDNATTSTEVFTVSPRTDAGVVGSKLNIMVTINKTL